MSARPFKILALIALVLALSVALALPGASGAAGVRPASTRAPAASAPRARISVVNGQAAEAGTFPWLAVVFHEGEGEAFQCTGTVVSPNVVLTAAHCVENPRTGHRYTASGYLIVTGTVDWTHTPR
ncbi:MAG TPA: trypsin-like serine protease, partial [Solirubrobacteraceae bacterium]|nr:trypsin-like serine protease [Solirubrobacteraceae bacterium]